MNILKKTRLIRANPFAALPREKYECPRLLDRKCLKNKITKLAFPSEASDAFFRESWSYYASDCKTRLRNIRKGIWQNIDNVIPFHKRKASSASSTFFQEPRLKTILGQASENNLNVDRVYKEFLKCFRPERCLALAKKRKAKSEPKIKPPPKPIIKPYSIEAVQTHHKYAPSDRKHRFAICHIFKYVTDKQLLEWEREANETKEVIKQTKDPYVMRELTKRLHRLNKLIELRVLNTPQMERTSESMPKRKKNKKLLKHKKRISPKGSHHPERFQMEHPSFESLPTRRNRHPLSIVKKKSAKDSVSKKNINVDSSTESSIYLDPTPSLSTVKDSIEMDMGTPFTHEEELPKPPYIDTNENYHLEISKSRIVSTITEPHIRAVEAKRMQEYHAKTHKLKKSAKVLSHAKSPKVKLKKNPSEKTLHLKKFNESIPNLKADDVTTHTQFHESLTQMPSIQLPQENIESTLDSGIQEFLKTQWKRNQNKAIDYIKPAMLEVIKRALKVPIGADNDKHSEQIQNLTQIKISTKFSNDLSSFLKRRHQHETKNQLDKTNKFKGTRESVRTSELNLITPISEKHPEHNKRIILPEPERLRILMRSFNRKIVYKNPYGKGRKLTPKQLARFSRPRSQSRYLDTKRDEDTASLYSTKSLLTTRRPIYSNKSTISHFSDVKTISDNTQNPLPEAKPMVISELVADFMSTRKMEDYFNNLYPGVIKPLLEDETPPTSEPGLIKPWPFNRPPTNRFRLNPDDFPIPKPAQKPSPPIILKKRKKQRVQFREKAKLIKKLDEEKKICCLCKLIYGSSQKTLPPCPRYMKNMQRRVEKLQLRNYFVQKMLENAKMQHPPSTELEVKDQTEPRTALDRQSLSSSYTVMSFDCQRKTNSWAFTEPLKSIL